MRWHNSLRGLGFGIVKNCCDLADEFLRSKKKTLIYLLRGDSKMMHTFPNMHQIYNKKTLVFLLRLLQR